MSRVAGYGVLVCSIVGTIGGWLIATHGSGERAVEAAALTAPFVIALAVALGLSAYNRWSENRAVEEIRRNRERRS